jgi:hypothetical protein
METVTLTINMNVRLALWCGGAMSNATMSTAKMANAANVA